MLSSVGLQRRNVEEDFDTKNRSNQLEKMKEIEKLDDSGNTEEADEKNKLPKTCLNCEDKGYKHMNRHFCDQSCASSYYWMQPNKNPYKPSGGKTKRRRTKRTKRRNGKTYRKQQKKQSKKL